MYNHVLGLLYGVAYGDAMGMPGEMWPRSEIQKRFGYVDHFLPGQEDHPISKGFAPGETTDDTAMTFLISSLLLDSACDPDPLEFVNRVEKWAESTGKSQLVIGPSTRMAFDKIKAGVTVSEAGKNGITNGASMRISPAGVLKDYRDSQFLHLVERLCMPTHYTNIAISAASAVAACVSAAIHDNEPDLRNIAISFAEKGEQFGNQLCGPSVARRLELAFDLSDIYAEDDELFLQNLYDVIGTGLPSNESIPAAIAIADRCGGDVIRCGILAANAGGDTDTLGAISCAISGAISGADRFPEEIITVLESANEFNFKEMAERLVAFQGKQ